MGLKSAHTLVASRYDKGFQRLFQPISLLETDRLLVQKDNTPLTEPAVSRQWKTMELSREQLHNKTAKVHRCFLKSSSVAFRGLLAGTALIGHE